MTPIALSPRPLHQLFASACARPACSGHVARSGGKKRTVAPANAVEAVPACSNVSIPGYRSNNRQRET